MQSAHHWDVLAEDVSEQVINSLNENLLYQSNATCLFIQADQTTFGDAFTKLLTSHLLDKRNDFNESLIGNISIATTNNDNCIQIKSSAQVIKHRADRNKRVYPGTWTMLTGAVAVMRDFAWYEMMIGAGVIADLFGGTFSSLPHSEVLMTTEISKDNRLLSLQTDIYYINDQDNSHYRQAKQFPTKNFLSVTHEAPSHTSL